MARARKDKKGRTLRKGESVRKSDGMYVYTYTDPLSKRRYVYASDLMALREKEEKLIKNQIEGLDQYVSGRVTVDFVFDRYISSKKRLRQSTRQNYIYTYDRYVRGSFGHNKIGKIRYSDVLFFYQDMVDNQGLSVSTVDTVNTLLYPTFKMAVRDDIIRKNPCEGIMAEIKDQYIGRKNRRIALAKEQQKRFVEFLDEPEQLVWKPIITVLLGTGCRIGEIIGIRWDDVDYEAREISINHTTTYLSKPPGGGKAHFVITPPKTRMGNRTIPMLDSVYEAFKEEKANQELLGRKCNLVIDGMTNFVFCNRFNNLIVPSSLNKVIKRIISDYNAREEIMALKEHREAVILPDFSCHTLRHTFCTRLCEVETNLKAIQAIMGHADIQTTMDIYADVTEDMKRNAISNLSDNFDM